MSAESQTQRVVQFLCSVHGPAPQCGCRVVCCTCAEEVAEEHKAEVRSLRRELEQAKKTIYERDGEIRGMKSTLDRLIVAEPQREIILGGKPGGV